MCCVNERAALLSWNCSDRGPPSCGKHSTHHDIPKLACEPITIAPLTDTQKAAPIHVPGLSALRTWGMSCSQVLVCIDCGWISGADAHRTRVFKSQVQSRLSANIPEGGFLHLRRSLPDVAKSTCSGSHSVHHLLGSLSPMVHSPNQLSVFKMLESTIFKSLEASLEESSFE